MASKAMEAESPRTSDGLLGSYRRHVAATMVRSAGNDALDLAARSQ